MFETLAICESNRELTPGYRLLTLGLKEDVELRAGQFAMLKPHRSVEPLLRRALAVYSVSGRRQPSFLYQVLGRGTEALSQLQKGAEVEALLPLGNAWPVEAHENRSAVVVAGGIGSASVFMLCQELLRARVDTQIFFGSRNERVAAGCGLEDFQSLGIPLTSTTDDGSLGEHGLITAPLERYLRNRNGVDLTVYACGPWMMMKRVAEIAEQFEVRCLVSLEAPMGCGFGVCVGCVVGVRTSDPLSYGSYKRVCIDGSIFPADQIRWEVNAMTH